MLAKVMPALEKWEIGLLWQVLEDARKDPEGMDIKKLHEGAMWIAKDVTKNYLVAAGGEEETMFSLVMKKMMEMVTKARKQSTLKMAGTLREAHGKNRFLELTKKGLMDRITEYQDVQEKQSDSALMKQVKHSAHKTQKSAPRTGQARRGTGLEQTPTTRQSEICSRKSCEPRGIFVSIQHISTKVASGIR